MKLFSRLYPAIFIFLILTASFILPSFLWGISAWGTFSATYAVILAILALIPFHPAIAPRSNPEHSPGKGKKGYFLRLTAALVITLVILWVFRKEHNLWGDGHAVSSALESGRHLVAGKPLSSFLQYLFYKFLGPILLIDASLSGTILSITAGVALLPVSLKLAALLHRSEGSFLPVRPATTVIIMLSGYSALLFGSPGSGAVAMLICALFLMSAILAFRGRVSFYLPSILLVLAIFAHPSAIFLIPGFIYMIIIQIRKSSPAGKPGLSSEEPGIGEKQENKNAGSGSSTGTGEGSKKKREVVMSLAIMAGFWILLDAFIMFGGGESNTGHLLGLISGTIRGNLPTPSHTATGYLKSILGGFLITGPLSVAAVILMVARIGRNRNREEGTSREEDLLMLFAIPAVMLIIIGGEWIENGLRWDALAPIAPVITVYSAWALKNRLGRQELFRPATLLLASVCVFHLIPLVIINHSPELAEKRLYTLPLHPGRAETILGRRAMERGGREEAIELFSRAVEKDTANAEVYYRLGKLYAGRKEYLDAITTYREALELDPFNTRYRRGLIEAYIGNRWYREAEVMLEELTSSYPDSVYYWSRLGYARNHSRDHSGAIRAYRKALELQPDEERNLTNLISAILNRGAQLQSEGNLEEAREQYHRATNLYPGAWSAYNNLAVMEMEEENYRKALEILREGLAANPNSSALNFNMGIVMEKLGNDRKALQYLQKSADLDPFYSRARHHIQRIREKLQKEE